MTDLTEILADNQKEMLKLITPAIKKKSTVQNLENSDSESESILTNTTLTPIRIKTTTSKTTPISSRNMLTGVLNDSPINPPKSQNNNVYISNMIKAVLRHQQDYCLHPKSKHSSHTTSSQCRKHTVLRYTFLR